jgi:DNA-binding CsgD family transcriptional regulator/tetratricopeptide (TPR) repeat protein
MEEREARANDAATAGDRLAVAPLLERESELRRIGAVLDAVQNSRAGACVAISGEAGIGKTALVEHFARLNAARLHCLHGGCEALFTPRPLGPLVDMADDLPPALADSVRSGRSLHELFAALLSYLRDAQRVTLVILEDVHWADEATLDFVKYLGRRVLQVPVLLLVTYRDDELPRDHPLRRVLGELPARSTHRLVLPLLSEQAVEKLAERAGRTAVGIHRATDGNPFFVTEVLAAAADTIPSSISDAMHARIMRLSAPARAVAEHVSLSPAHLEVELVGALLGPATAAIDECVAQGLLVVTGRWLGYRHELARQSIEEALSAARRLELHAAMFGALRDIARQAVPLSRLVHHAEGAGLDGEVLQLAPIAAREAARSSAHREAAALYALALAHAGRLDGAARAELLEARAHECMLTNLPDEAIEARTRALALRRALADIEHEGIDLRELSRSYWNRNADPAAREYARAAVDVLQRLPPGRELAMAYSVMAHLHLVGEDVPTAIDWGNRAIALAATLDDAEALSHALNTVGTAEMRTRRELSSWAKLERSLALALSHGLEEHAARAYNNLYIVSVLHRDYARGLGYAAQGIAYCDERDIDVFSVRLRIRRAYTYIELGRWADAQRDLAVLDESLTPSPMERATCEFVRGVLALRQGAPESGSRITELAAQLRAIGIELWFTTTAAACAEATWLRDDADGVERAINAELDAAIALGEPYRTGQLAVWLRRVGRLPDDFHHAVARPYELELAGDFREAAREWAALGCPYDQALALLAGDETAMRDGLRILDALGAKPAAELARRRLHAIGARGVQRGRYGHARADPQGLTRREREISELVASGMSNEDIARQLHRSTRTIEHHVSAILGKLGVSSRAQAIALARDAGRGRK